MSFLQWRGRTSDASTSGIESGALSSAENSPDVIPGTPESIEQDLGDTPRLHRFGLYKARNLQNEQKSSKWSGSDKVSVPESDDEIIEDSFSEKKITVESEGEVILDSEDEDLPDLTKICNGKKKRQPYLFHNSLSADVSSPTGSMFDHLKVDGKIKENLSSTPTLDTSNWRSNSKADVESDEDYESHVFVGKHSRRKNIILTDESSDEYNSDNNGDSVQEHSSLDNTEEDQEISDDYSDSPDVDRTKKNENHVEELDESDFSIPMYKSAASRKEKGHVHSENDSGSQEANETQDIADTSGSIDDSLLIPVFKKKFSNRIESDDEAASITSFKSVSNTSSHNSHLEIDEDSALGIKDAAAPIASQEKEKALTPQEKYGHKFKIKKKTPLNTEKSAKSSDTSTSNSDVFSSPVSVQSPDIDSALTPQERYGHKFKIKKQTPQKDSSFNEHQGSPLQTPSSRSPYKHNSLLEVSASNQSLESSFVLSDLTSSEMMMKLKEKKKLLKTTNLSVLPDGGTKIRTQVQELEEALKNLSMNSIEGDTPAQIDEPIFLKACSPGVINCYGKSPQNKELESSIIIEDEHQSPTSPTLKELERKLEKKKIRYSRADLGSLVDGGMKMRKKISLLEQEIARRKGSLSEMYRFDASQVGSVKEEDTKKTSSAGDAVGELESKKQKLQELKMIYRAANPRSLPDGGARLKDRITNLEKEIMMLQLKEDIEIKTTSPPEVITVEGPKMHYKQSKITDYGLASAVAAKSKDTQRNLGAFNMDAMYDIAMDYGARNYGGKISSKREREMIKVTAEAVQDLHDALESAPDVEKVLVDKNDPEGLLVSLMPHQRKALAWILWRESQFPRGGILADDMGLGKTLTMISLILKHQELVKAGKISEDFTGLNDSSQESAAENSEEEKWIQKKNYVALPKRKKLVPSSGTLVVCPASLLGQWEGEIKKRCTKGKLKSLLYHGTNREYNIQAMAHFDVVITTYQLVMREAFPSGKEQIKANKDEVPKINAQDQGRLFQVAWARIIIDEGHQIRNHKSKTSQATCMLRGGRRWVLTGTPVQNKEMDLYSLIRFLRMKPFDDYTCWKLQVSNNSAQGMRRLSLIVKALMLRRTKDQIDQDTGKQLVELPEKTIVQHTLNLNQKEREVYDRIFQFSRSTMTNYMKSQEEKELEKFQKWGGKGESLFKKVDDHRYTPTLPAAKEEGMKGEVRAHHLLILLLRLRQICSHPSLIKGMVETETEAEDDGMDSAEKDGLELDIVSHMAEMSLRPTDDIEEEADTNVKKNILTMDNPIFQRSASSSKIESVIEEIKNIRRNGKEQGFREKSVIVSQWTSMLDVVKEHLHNVGIRCHVISGQVLVKERSSIVEDFNSNPKGPKVMLLSLGAGGVGLNLVGANHLFLLDMHWNPQLEAQACDRIYRVGQTRPVTIHRFVIQNTVEERILELQQKKLQLAEEVLSGVKRTNQNKLTLEDMKALFDIGGKDSAASFPK